MMKKTNFKLMGLAILFVIFSVFLFSNIYADVNYGNLNSRVNQNRTMINSSNNMNSIDRMRYSDKYLTDLVETNYKGLSTYQQTVIRDFANNTILEGKGNSITAYNKVLKFHDWIVANYYYYSTPNKLSTLKNFGNVYDNPYYLLTYEYKSTGKVRARSNGYASMLVALSRSQGIPARTVGGYYYQSADQNYTSWGSNVKSNNINQIFVEVYVNGKWIVVDPASDCYNVYNSVNDEYITSEGSDNHKYFNPNIDVLSTTHIMFKHYAGLKSVLYVTNTYEKSKITSFLNKSYNKKTNGKKINTSYSRTKPSTWFPKGTTSRGDGYGRVSKIIWPKNKGLVGSLDLSGFASLEQVYAPSNKISSLKIVNSPSLNTVSLSYNNISNLTVTGSKNLRLLSTYRNPMKYAKYNFGPSMRTAIIKTTRGGTFSVRYEKTSRGYQHKLYARTKAGYTFKGWYKGNRRISKKSSITIYNNRSFTYTARYQKKSNKTYVIVSIKNQKLWYYKKGRLILSTNVVTGQKGKHDTPRGTFKIRGKARNVYLIGPDYKSFVNYWMLIDSSTQIGLHDASWRWKFGGSIYKYNGSHGCVNMPYKKARYVYNYVPTGTKVIVK